MICSGLSIAPSFVNALATKHHEDVLFKTPLLTGWPWVGIGESEAWKEPGCSLQDPPPRGRPARPRWLNVLGRKPRCSLQECRHDASGRVDAAAGGCERQPRDGFASSSFDNRDGLHATFGGCRAPPRHTQDRFGVYGGGSRGDAAPGKPVGCTPLGRDAVGTAEKPAGKTDSSAAGKPFPPRFVSGPTFRKSEG